jgi:hypothetical protein
MLELAKARVDRADANRVEFLQADARDAQWEESAYDLIVTHFFLDCFDQGDLPMLVDQIACAANPEARWIVSEFRPANRAGRLCIATMYLFFGMATDLETRSLADHHPHLLRKGFRLRRSELAWGGMLASELWIRGAE